ncbi:MAG: hypothetical protein FWF76_06020 [Oscillospiraceae bacterium]|nr:hypothetical protein [Oscillospiraceae bacterium]
MGGIIKQTGSSGQGDFVSVVGIAPSNIMFSPNETIKTRSIDNGENESGVKAQKKELSSSERRAKTEQEYRDKLEERVDEIVAEHKKACTQMKAEYEEKCKKVFEEAEADSFKAVEEATETAELVRNAAEKDAVNIRKEAEKSGYSDGYEAGEKAGHEDGFAKGREECGETLRELTVAFERIPEEKAKIFKEYENQLFDLIFTISNKITANSLNQKDKSVISKMLKETARGFRGSAFVKVSLSKIDVEESANVDLDELSRVFGNLGDTKQVVEFEILKDAPKGTLILDNGSEITDAGIQTQLKMIENIGKGKFRNASADIPFEKKLVDKTNVINSINSKIKPDEIDSDEESED